jgi:hypothetical protein
MDNFSITFIVFTDSLDNQGLLRTVTSLRAQEDFSWSIEIRSSEVPNEVDQKLFTHDNPRISIVLNHTSQPLATKNSKVFAVLPRGTELFPNACGELKKAFDQDGVDIVVANIIAIADEHRDTAPQVSHSLPFVTSVRQQKISMETVSIREILLPLGKLDLAALSVTPSRNVKVSSENRDEMIRSKYISELETENFFLAEQVRSLTSKSDEFIATQSNLFIVQNRLSAAETQLKQIRESRTWRVGRIVLMPIRVLKRLAKHSKNS